MRRIFLVIFLVIVFNYTGSPLANYAFEDKPEELKLYLGEVKIIPVRNPIRVAIGNPAVIDTSSITKTELTISPKAPGKTTLVFWDSFGEQSYLVRVFTENIQEVKRRIDGLLAKLNLPDVRTQAEEDEGRIFLTGSVKTAQDREKISLVLGPLKSKTVDLLMIKEEETAIEIDVQVLEIDKDATTTLGFSNPLSGGPITFTEVGTKALTGAPLGSMFKVDQFSRGAFSWKLDALIQEGKARILSRPRLACQSGKEAELLVGGEKPIFTTEVASTTGAAGTTVEYKEYGIKLKIKPTVNDEQRIKVGLNVEISEVGAAETIGATSAPTAKAYPLTKRDVATELLLDNGQTLAIGGLIKQKHEEDVVRTPFLSDIPVVGLFFRKKTTKVGGGQGERGNTELFITLTPRIVNRHNPAPLPSEKKAAVADEVVALPEVNIPEALRGYTSIIQRRILDNLVYPASAKESGFQGTVKLSLHLSYLGQLLDVSVKNSSGYKILDDNTVNTAKSLASYPPFPASTEEKELWIDVPIAYRLN